ncbi:hypothetical protein DL767_011417 [Monosporascus sp. MG133]|nr:hypothetical protein DL767_011417 [Monosporascus sp. MG133]
MAPQDSFIDDEDDTCPLCIEEFDLSDRNFRPCPCGYQICQFCFNNLKNNLNGLCPACRRPYDEKTIQWKVVTPEEEAEFRANIQKNQKKRASEQRQKEAQKREAEKENRKNLVGVRVVQKNLVYVTGLTPTVREDELLKTLRKPEFFGQYGNIQKISISNRKSSDGQAQSLGIYVTFEKKEDAARCIQAVNGSQNGDRILRAQLGTTKYCSAWLRHEQCVNRQCMFLHELGDEEDSYTRQDLSSLNSVHTQRPIANAASSSRSASRQQVSAPQPPAPASHAMVRTSSKEGSDTGDGPALPASANWARTTQQRSRRGSHATSGAASSPAISASLPVTAESPREAANTTPAPDAKGTTSRKTEKQPAAEASPNPPKSDTGSAGRAATKSDALDLSTILKILAACPASAFAPPKDASDSYPPLFDIRGGERRRALREEEEARLNGEEVQVENAEPADGEPGSGSLALGGEPEERDQSRNGGAFDQRRNHGQPPIQRANTDGPFGPSLTGFGAGSAAGSVSGRTMTPQQTVFVRPQSSFIDQMPPGLPAQQSSLFQGQGHTRQQSRFSFANENTANSTNVKLATDPRILAQQSSMMPSSYRTQPGGPFYAGGGSIPGPPPGLKPSATPPVGGSMFGQGHGFAGSAFGATSKDNSNELLQSLIRGRGAGSSQAHDAGKREYLSFSNQYPSSTSSTPAPASGLMATLYGTQPGAFQDFGPKQKKKGKKHRHANTSSSGGSGLVDLADPSILQARMQHQQQGNNTGVGQGLFGGQSQDDDLLPLDEASSSVDALVADDDELQVQLLPSGIFTPSAPPGLGVSHAHPTPIGERRPTPGAQIRIPTPSAVPLSPAIPRPVTPLVPKSATKSKNPVVKDEASPATIDARKTIKELAARSGLSKDIASQALQASKTPKGKRVLQDEDFPALDSPKTGSTPKVTPALPSRHGQPTKAAQEKKSVGNTPSKPPAEKSTPKAEKRPVPGVLDIEAATKNVLQRSILEAAGAIDKSSEQGSSSAAEPSKSQATSAVHTPTPTTASVSSPLTRAVPKTLRLVQTPRAETPPATVLPAVAASIRSAGVSSSAHRPATPVSEIISDSASVVSASISASRTSSPPPSKIGSASIRPTTKSQQRKQRKEASKEAAAHLAETKPAEQEVEIAPIVGRKKKQKKEKKSNNASAAPSRPETPQATPKDASAQANGPKQPGDNSGSNTSSSNSSAKAREDKGKDKDAQATLKSPTQVDTSIRLNESTKTTVLTPDYVSHTPEAKLEQPVDEDLGDIPNITEVLRTLIREGSLPEAEKISLFKAPQNHPQRVDHNSNATAVGPPTLKRIVAKEDEEQLNAFQPVRKVVDGHSVLLTPNGDCLLNLTQEEADRFLELQDRLRADSALPTAFSAPRYAPASGFSLVKNRAVPNGTPSFFPSGPDNYPSDPVGKMHREEAISCINQHVLPSLNLSSYKTMGPNANFTKNVNLQQLAPWIYPSHETADGRMFGGRSADEYGTMPNGNVAHIDSAYGSYDSATDAISPSPAIGSTPLMSVEESETVLAQAKKQHEAIDKKFRQLQAKNRRLLDIH